MDPMSTDTLGHLNCHDLVVRHTDLMTACSSHIFSYFAEMLLCIL